MRKLKNSLHVLLMIVTCAILISFLQGCGNSAAKENETYISREDAVYFVAENQTIEVTNKNNEQEKFAVNGDWYLISADRLETILKVFHDLQGRSNETDAIID